MNKNITPWGKQCKIQMFTLGKSLTDVSKEIGLSRTYISAIINGRCLAPKETVRKISENLKIDPDLNISMGGDKESGKCNSED